MSEMKTLTIGNNTYEVADAVARANIDNVGNIDIPKIYKWEQHKSGLDSYTTGATQTLSGNFTSEIVSMPNSYAVGYKTVEEAFSRPSGASTYSYVGKTSINSEYPYVYLKNATGYADSGTAWTDGVYKVTAISIKTTASTQNYLTNYKYTYNITGQLLSNPVYVDELLGYKYGLSEEYVQLFPTDNNISYVLTNPD